MLAQPLTSKHRIRIADAILISPPLFADVISSRNDSFLAIRGSNQKNINKIKPIINFLELSSTAGLGGTGDNAFLYPGWRAMQTLPQVRLGAKRFALP
jgi:hypothetical protein